MADAREHMRMMQANMEGMMGQLDLKTKEAAAAVAEASKQRELVAQITKKLDTVSKRNKQLEKESQRAAEARSTMVSTEVQCDPDARLVAATAEVAALTTA
eukprot:3032169-Prymnesium_polylepis.1